MVVAETQKADWTFGKATAPKIHRPGLERCRIFEVRFIMTILNPSLILAATNFEKNKPMIFAKVRISPGPIGEIDSNKNRFLFEFPQMVSLKIANRSLLP